MNTSSITTLVDAGKLIRSQSTDIAELRRVSRQLRALHQSNCNNRLYCSCKEKLMIIEINQLLTVAQKSPPKQGPQVTKRINERKGTHTTTDNTSQEIWSIISITKTSRIEVDTFRGSEDAVVAYIDSLNQHLARAGAGERYTYRLGW